jgi:hypothetical protein
MDTLAVDFGPYRAQPFECFRGLLALFLFSVLRIFAFQ